MRVLIVDDEKMGRETVEAILERVPDIEIVGMARDGVEAVAMARKLQPDVVTMDIKMPGLGGLEATKRLNALEAHPRVVIVSSSWEEDMLCQALECGAKGYVVKTDVFVDLVPAVRAARVNKKYLSSTVNQWAAKDGGKAKPCGD